MPTLEIPAQGKTRSVTLKCSTGKAESRTETEFQASMPASLGDAIALETEKGVFRRYLNSLAIELQGEQRQKLAPEGEKKERKRARYLEELGVYSRGRLDARRMYR
ncbi:MAG: hypothetical protein ACRD2L_09750 [Terriglobia bacterium]